MSDESSGLLTDAFVTNYGTSGDAQFGFRNHKSSAAGESQIRVLAPLEIAHVDPAHPRQEKSALLESEPATKFKNQVIFNATSRTTDLNPKDLMLIEPGNDLYIRSLSLDHGIQLELHGTVRNVLSGAGTKKYKSCMPSVFDTLNSEKRVFGAIPGVVAFILTLLEALGFLPGKKK